MPDISRELSESTCGPLAQWDQTDWPETLRISKRSFENHDFCTNADAEEIKGKTILNPSKLIKS